ncbi:MAG: phosphoenolpyruvate carboxylase, partial [Ferruginibacter sp.]
MDYRTSNSLEQFKTYIGLPFQLYNSLFTSLPFHKIEKTGILLSLFLENCIEGYDRGESPTEIVEHFFLKHTTYIEPAEKIDLLFRFVQYVERQIVLFDALEDAAFTQVNDVNGSGTLKYLGSEVFQRNVYHQMEEKLQEFAVRIVLTAHPTQFYPGPVLGIIHDLSAALKHNEANKVNMYLQQLGKTAFLNKSKPTPFDEALSLIWFLEHVFYSSTAKLTGFLRNEFPTIYANKNTAISLGFWPGGDRDGNPNVNTTITLQVAAALRASIIKCYYRDIQKMKRRLTFKGIEELLTELEMVLHQNISQQGSIVITEENILTSLQKVRDIVNNEHGGLFIFLVDDLICKVQVFGLYFASLDIRQESSIHSKVLEEIAVRERILEDYVALTAAKKIHKLSRLSIAADISLYSGIVQDTLLS